jgi:hypothetical protein
MSSSRRSLIMTLVGGAGFLAGGAELYPRPQRPSIEPRPSPNTPDPDHPWGLGGHDEKPRDSKAIDKQNQAEIRDGVEKLYVLITDLREEIEKSDANKTLSVSVVKKSQQIEKLAKHVRDLAKG